MQRTRRLNSRLATFAIPVAAPAEFSQGAVHLPSLFFGCSSHTGLVWPTDHKAIIKTFATGSAQLNRQIAQVRLLGHDQPVIWTRGPDGLRVQLPEETPQDRVYVLRIDRH